MSLCFEVETLPVFFCFLFLIPLLNILTDDHRCICTDDRGIFNITLTQEWELICSTFRLSKDRALELSRRSLQLIFDADPRLQRFLHGAFEAFQTSGAAAKQKASSPPQKRMP